LASFVELAISKSHEKLQTTFINFVVLAFHKTNAHCTTLGLINLQQTTQRKFSYPQFQKHSTNPSLVIFRIQHLICPFIKSSFEMILFHLLSSHKVFRFFKTPPNSRGKIYWVLDLFRKVFVSIYMGTNCGT
jgi:hypothetical protein